MLKCLSGTGSSIQISSSNGAIGKCSSLSSSSSSALVRWQAIWCSAGEALSVLAGSGLVSVDELSSSLNVKWWHVLMRLLGNWGEYAWCVSCVAGLKDKFSLAETWYRHGALRREWEYLSFHSHCHNLHLPEQVVAQQCHLAWSWSDQIILLLCTS